MQITGRKNRADDENKSHLYDALHSLIKCQYRTGHVCGGCLWVCSDSLLFSCLFHCENFLWRRVAGLLVLDGPEHQPCCEDREKTVSVRQQCAAIGKCDQPKGKKFIAAQTFPAFTAEVKHESSDGCAAGRANGKSPADRPGYIDDQPSPSPSANLVQTEQTKPEHHEG